MIYLRSFFLAGLLVISPLVYGGQSPVVQTYFSPKDSVADHLIALIEKEEKSILVAVYCLTHRGISQALIDAKHRGVEVEVILDPFSIKPRFPVGKLVKAGIPVFVWDPLLSSSAKAANQKRKKFPLMHHKFCVFGNKSVWTGSFNFTYNADSSSRENAVFIEDGETAKRFQDQFRSIKFKGCRHYEEYLSLHQKVKKK